MIAPTLGRTAGSVPRGLIGMIGMIILVESIISYHHLDFTRFYIHDWRAIGDTIRTQSPDCSVLCFGDSLVKFGVLPRVIQDRTDARVYNLSLCGGQAASSYFLLRRAIDAKSRPTTVLVDYAPHLLMAEPRHNMRQWPELLSLSESIELGLAAKHAGFCAELALRWIFPSMKDRDEVRGGILAALRGRPASRRDDVLAHRQVWEQNLGSDIHPARSSFDVNDELDLSNPGYFPRTWSCHKVNAYYIHAFLKLAASNHVQVVWLLPPVGPRFQARRDELGLESKYTAFLKPMIAKYPNLTVLDARHSGYDSSLFVDSLHLSRPGADAFSREIATALVSIEADASSTGRWVRVPGVRLRTASSIPADCVDLSIALRLPIKGHRR
ncbi:hypothetical protein SAMN05444166_6988 [Singulisphaera sp. GP187]|uniref:hypothetical protein n=1 Tax=Singulisphaera sp. GP187 TaxID=1882752 RepID=UPI00092BC4CA|nr:hypothetical protein [Singulisphaera sp. GP187]SIO62240.1 hypothetical protein SAMN05444166_6988 [Singulisphaera sp. GP187]